MSASLAVFAGIPQSVCERLNCVCLAVDIRINRTTRLARLWRSWLESWKALAGKKAPTTTESRAWPRFIILNRTSALNLSRLTFVCSTKLTSIAFRAYSPSSSPACRSSKITFHYVGSEDTSPRQASHRLCCMVFDSLRYTLFCPSIPRKWMFWIMIQPLNISTDTML